MSARRYAEVSVNSPVPRRGTFSYSIPDNLKIVPGQAVRVPFGDKTLQGIVIELTEQPAVENTRDISGIIDTRPVLSPVHIQLAVWLSNYYFCPLFEAVALMLPPGFERKILTYFSVVNTDISNIPDDEREILEFIAARRVLAGEVKKKFGVRKTEKLVNSLSVRGFLQKTFELQKPKVSLKTIAFYRPATILSDLKLIKRQSELMAFLNGQPSAVTLADIKTRFSNPAMMIKKLLKAGLIIREEKEFIRDPLSGKRIVFVPPHFLTRAQQDVLDCITTSIKENHPSIFLLHGVTASGKTEVYIRALEEAVKQGKQGIVLVPEIAMTPQTIERFTSRFPGRVAILHSGLTPGEQFDEWRYIREGKFDVVIGPRSALFAPIPDLGLIVIDEAHEWTYKQDNMPYYDARIAAGKLAELTGATLIFGSATPDVEQYYEAKTGLTRLLELPERVTKESAMPEVKVVDLREEFKRGSRSLFSRSLLKAIGEVLDSKQQAILFLNRRGSASFIQCRQCGFAFRCKRCGVALKYHPDRDLLICHQCNATAALPESCPKCGSPHLKFLGSGIQKVELEVVQHFPRVRTIRWDSDVTASWQSHEEILSRFKAHEADILIGTQMVAKGLDIPGVTLVGVVNADTGLDLPDFRAGERTFQQLCQVAGRAGRGDVKGRVIIQTYAPEHYAVQSAAAQDYIAFYNKEIEFRRILNYPPFSRLTALTFNNTAENTSHQQADQMKAILEIEAGARGLTGFSLIGPAPAFRYHLRGKFRWQIIMRCNDPVSLLENISIPRGCSVNIDPIGLN